MNIPNTGLLEMRQTISVLCLLISCVLLYECQNTKQESSELQPNIIFILADDLGWKDVGFNGSKFYETPNLDKMANIGIQFTNAYANAPNCAPTRACIMTGQYPQRHGILTVGRSDRGDQKAQKLIPVPNIEVLDTATISLAEMLKNAGYSTAFIGKWHVGSHLNTSPYAHGFDFSVAAWERGSPRSYFSPYRNPALKDGPVGEYLTDRLTEEAIAYLKSQAKERSPFFLYLSYYAVHAPFQAKDGLIQKYKTKKVIDDQDNPVYAAMIETLDNNIGRLITYLDAEGLMENTILVFYSDNGGSFRATKNTPLKGAKGMLYEGGIRVPAFVYAPSLYKKMKIIDEPVISTDLYPTIAEWAGANIAKNQIVDGESLIPLIEDAGQRSKPLFWYTPVYLPGNSEYAFRSTPGAAIRKGDYKLIRRFDVPQAELYNVTLDLSEKNDLAKTELKLYKELYNELEKWLDATGAQICNDLNPKYDSSYTFNKYKSIRFQ